MEFDAKFWEMVLWGLLAVIALSFITMVWAALKVIRILFLVVAILAGMAAYYAYGQKQDEESIIPNATKLERTADKLIKGAKNIGENVTDLLPKEKTQLEKINDKVSDTVDKTVDKYDNAADSIADTGKKWMDTVIKKVGEYAEKEDKQKEIDPSEYKK